MRVEVRDGRAVWVKSDGSVSKKPVGNTTAIRAMGFPLPSSRWYPNRPCTKIEVLEGDPYSDARIIVDASGNGWWGEYILGKDGRIETLHDYHCRTGPERTAAKAEAVRAALTRDDLMPEQRRRYEAYLANRQRGLASTPRGGNATLILDWTVEDWYEHAKWHRIVGYMERSSALTEIAERLRKAKAATLRQASQALQVELLRAIKEVLP